MKKLFLVLLLIFSVSINMNAQYLSVSKMIEVIDNKISYASTFQQLGYVHVYQDGIIDIWVRDCKLGKRGRDLFEYDICEISSPKASVIELGADWAICLTVIGEDNARSLVDEMIHLGFKKTRAEDEYISDNEWRFVNASTGKKLSLKEYPNEVYRLAYYQ